MLYNMQTMFAYAVVRGSKQAEVVMTGHLYGSTSFEFYKLFIGLTTQLTRALEQTKTKWQHRIELHLLQPSCLRTLYMILKV